MYRVLTISREFGSGGGRIGRSISEKLGWKLLDKAFIDNIARAAKVDPQLAQQFDERTDTWLERLGRQGLWMGALEGIALFNQPETFDAETMATLAQKMIGEAYRAGNCVIVGRGAQCVLQNCDDAVNVFVFAPWAQRMAEVQRRLPEEKNVEERIRSMDRQRADYIRSYFGCDWMDPHLYNLMISSALGEDVVESTILSVLAGGGSLRASLAS